MPVIPPNVQAVVDAKAIRAKQPGPLAVPLVGRAILKRFAGSLALRLYLFERPAAPLAV